MYQSRFISRPAQCTGMHAESGRQCAIVSQRTAPSPSSGIEETTALPQIGPVQRQIVDPEQLYAARLVPVAVVSSDFPTHPSFGAEMAQIRLHPALNAHQIHPVYLRQ